MTVDDSTLIALAGVTGRMGGMILRAIVDDASCRVVSAISSSSSPYLGTDIGTLIGGEVQGVIVTDDAEGMFASKPQVVIDVTTPKAAADHAKLAAVHGAAIVVCTTGLDQTHEKTLREAAEKIAVVRCPNTSVGVTMLARLVTRAAKNLRDDWDIEIAETHHRNKIDAPSGTALRLAEAVAKGRGITFDQEVAHDRSGKRKKGDIGFSVSRGGNVVGEHRVIFYGENEQIELTHRATDRIIFARGALRAAKWAAIAPPGLYEMDDVISDVHQAGDNHG